MSTPCRRESSWQRDSTMQSPSTLSANSRSSHDQAENQLAAPGAACLDRVQMPILPGAIQVDASVLRNCQLRPRLLWVVAPAPETGEDNGDAHSKSCITCRSMTESMKELSATSDNWCEALAHPHSNNKTIAAMSPPSANKEGGHPFHAFCLISGIKQSLPKSRIN